VGVVLVLHFASYLEGTVTKYAYQNANLVVLALLIALLGKNHELVDHG
jgi:hypothetical protein